MHCVTSVWNRLCLLRFVVVGAWNTLVSYIVFAVFYFLFGGGWGDVLVQGLSAIVGISHAYLMHRLITYRSSGIWWKEYLRFYVVYGLQVVLQAVFFFVFATWLGYNGYVIQLVTLLVFTIVSYWAHKKYSFKVA